MLVEILSNLTVAVNYLFIFCYRNIFLGEVFSSYVSVHNDSNQPVKDIVIKVRGFYLHCYSWYSLDRTYFEHRLLPCLF